MKKPDADRSSEALVERLKNLRDEMLRAAPVRYYPRAAAYFPEAALATELCPLMEQELEKTPQRIVPKIFIVGDEGKYLESGSPKWAEFLKKWGVKGKAQIFYLLLAPSPSVIERIQEIVKNTNSTVQFYRPATSDGRMPKEVQECFKRWKNHHFVICENPRFLWIEGYHPSECVKARDCAFFDGEACKSSPDWDIYNSAMNASWEHVELLFPQSTTRPVKQGNITGGIKVRGIQVR